MNGLEGALCRGQWWLFDSTDLSDHVEARKLCAECPAIVACRQILREVDNFSNPANGGPVGTWAGRLVGAKRKTSEDAAEGSRFAAWMRQQYGVAV